MIRECNECRLCGEAVKTVLKLTDTPIANSFPDTPNSGEKYPLELRECTACGHVQIGHIVEDSLLYGEAYSYHTPEAQLPDLAAQAVKLRGIYPWAHSVLEIGANNGLFMSVLEDVFDSVTGIDPSSWQPNIIPHAFGTETVKLIGKVDLIVANNVFAHVDDLHDVFTAIDQLLGLSGALVFEVQYLPEMVARGAFDMIYHEHKDYHTLKPLVPFLKKHNLGIKMVEYIQNHGGSIRLYCGRGSSIPILDESPIAWTEFAQRIGRAKQRCIEALHEARNRKIGAGRVCAFGATAKACTLIHHFGIADELYYAVDSTPEKQGKYIPGTDLKIFSESDAMASKSGKKFLLTAWNYAKHIQAKYPHEEFILPFGAAA